MRIEWCRDRDCARVIEGQDVSGTSAQPSAPLPTGSVFWRVVRGASVRSATWQVWIGRASAPNDSSFGSVLDLNGDGFGDLAASAPASSAGGVGAGAVRVFFGGASLSSGMRAVRLTGSAGDEFGDVISSAGDVNGDGFADLAIAAVKADVVAPSGMLANAGKVFVYLGSAMGIATTPSLTLDGVTAGDSFGASVAAAGDVNGDGYGDLFVGARRAMGAEANTGVFSLFLGGPTGLSATPVGRWLGRDSAEWYGLTVAGAGDVNGDGLSDLVVGASYANPNGLRQAGRFEVFAGSETGLSPTAINTMTGESAFMTLGSAFSLSFDWNRDGIQDIVAGARYDSPSGLHFAGSVRAYFGGTGALRSTHDAIIAGLDADSLFGHSVASVGDVDGDGIDDLAVGAPQGPSPSASNAGFVQLFLRGIMAIDPALRRNGVSAVDTFGGSISGSDLDGDGFSDLVIGARFVDLNGRTNTGRVYVYRGSSNGPSADPTFTIDGELDGEAFGHALAQ